MHDAAKEPHLATLANALTLLRLLAAPLLVAAILCEAYGIAAALFTIAVGTDVFDGWLARRSGETSVRGALFDHAVDAIFVTAGSAAFAWHGALPMLLPALIALAFVQYALDSALDSDRGARGTLRASALGRCNGIGYYVLVALAIAHALSGLGGTSRSVLMGLGWLLAFSSGASIAVRLSAARNAHRNRS